MERREIIHTVPQYQVCKLYDEYSRTPGDKRQLGGSVGYVRPDRQVVAFNRHVLRGVRDTGSEGIYSPRTDLDGAQTLRK